jgi:ribose/xylose/arabinose/galactoside ABC-type transport system permease subunit
MNEAFKTALVKFAIDLATGAISGASAVLAATDLDVANPKVLAIALFVGALNGAINAARRYTAAQVA